MLKDRQTPITYISNVAPIWSSVPELAEHCFDRQMRRLQAVEGQLEKRDYPWSLLSPSTTYD